MAVSQGALAEANTAFMTWLLQGAVRWQREGGEIGGEVIQEGWPQARHLWLS